MYLAGEEGIDNGAMAKEYFTNIMNEIRKNVFPDGSPQNSMLSVHNGTFYSCGQIVATSIAQGGPPPCFLEDCVYDMLVLGNFNMNALIPEKHLTSHEQTLIKSIKDNLTLMQDVILEHEYTGKIDKEHVDDIIGTVMVSIISKRLL